jgi:hypothetical protein
MENKDKEAYELDKQNHIKYINEQYKGHNLELVKTEDLKKLKVKKFFSGIMTGIIIFIGILILCSVLFYGFYYDKFKSEIICGNQTCESSCPSIPACPVCPECKPSLSCVFPDKIDINIKNSTG